MSMSLSNAEVSDVGFFDHMLEREGSEPSRIAYDRPSPKLIGFLRKHFNLVNFVPQNNNFVVFNEYFEKKSVPQRPTSISDSKPPLPGGRVAEREIRDVPPQPVFGQHTTRHDASFDRHRPEPEKAGSSGMNSSSVITSCNTILRLTVPNNWEGNPKH
eukprot:TRINITY_DN3093_c0_g1_i10.p1 TRINITY_DN3093_c0_g1~~TRINITY_DN3093_c0_g1_i10.p1  ORF type:complete len:158 (-),score=15.65 TRINITY_DN3093_c0_g1_i10:385-858(-)